jgi:hypothetical protein
MNWQAGCIPTSGSSVTFPTIIAQAEAGPVGSRLQDAAEIAELSKQLAPNQIHQKAWK